MKTVWLSYTWEDNKNQDVDFLAQELESSGLKVKLDRWNIQAGKRLWEQIENFIINKNECDAWLLYATPNSLGSEPCREEFAYALDRALSSRNNDFPVIGVFPSTINHELIPAAIRTRLYVSLSDPDWKERIKASVEGRLLDIKKSIIQPYELNFHKFDVADKHFEIIEIRTRIGEWTPSFVGILMSEKDKVQPTTKYGPRGVYNQGSAMRMTSQGVSDDGLWWLMSAENEVTINKSVFLMCQELPSQIAFGVHNSTPQYLHKLK